MSTLNTLKCGHCNTENSVAKCIKCSRNFVITAEHIEGNLRDFDSKPVVVEDANVYELCDFCMFESLGKGSGEKISAGLRQITCPACHIEFLSEHGY